MIAWLGTASSTLTLIMPDYAPSVLGASCTSSMDCSDASVSYGTSTGHCELEGTRARLPMLAIGGATRGKYGGITRRAVGR
jgi:hypothetical protein